VPKPLGNRRSQRKSDEGIAPTTPTLERNLQNFVLFVSSW